MIPVRFSRRRLLGSVLAALTGLLMPHQRRSIAAPLRPVSPAIRAPNESPVVVTRTYDGSGRLLSVAEHPTTGTQGGLGSPPDWVSDLRRGISVYSYAGNGFFSPANHPAS